jgi:hypothetical protein
MYCEDTSTKRAENAAQNYALINKKLSTKNNFPWRYTKIILPEKVINL